MYDMSNAVVTVYLYEDGGNSIACSLLLEHLPISSVIDKALNLEADESAPQYFYLKHFNRSETAVFLNLY